MPSPFSFIAFGVVIVAVFMFMYALYTGRGLKQAMYIASPPVLFIGLPLLLIGGTIYGISELMGDD